MATPLTAEEFDKKLESLPKDIRGVATSDAILEKVEGIGRNRGLHIDQIGGLAVETALLMLGETPLDGFSKHLASALGIASNVADAIVSDLNREIFSPIRGSLMSIQQKREAVAPGPRDALATNIRKPQEQLPSYPVTQSMTQKPQGQLISESVSRSTPPKPQGQLISESVNQLISKPVNPQTNQSANQPINQSTARQSTSQPVNQLTSQPINQSPTDALSQKLTRPTVNPPQEIKSAPAPSAQKVTDPYREVVE